MVFRVPLHKSKPNELRHRHRTLKRKEAKQSKDSLFTRGLFGFTFGVSKGLDDQNLKLLCVPWPLWLSWLYRHPVH